MFKLSSFLICAAVLFGMSIAAMAGVPQSINYQAVLLDSQGDPVTTPVDIVFTIYDAPSVGNIIWQETKYGVTPDANGQFNLILGKTVPITENVMTGQALWLGIKVGADNEISPRTELVSSAYSFRVNTIDQANAGTIYGPFTIEESLAKADAKLTITCGAKAPDTVQINACGGVILRATNDIGEEVLSANIDQVTQTAELGIRVDGADLALLNAYGIEFHTNVAKDGMTLQKKYVYGGEGIQQLGANVTDILGEWGEMAAGQPYIGMTDYSAKAAGANIQIRPPSAALDDVFTIKTSTGDPTFNLQSDPAAGAEISFYTPNVTRISAEKTRLGNLGLSFFGDNSGEELLLVEEETPGVVSITGTDYSAKAAGASVKIKPPTAVSSDVFTVETSTGSPTFQIQTNPSGATSMNFDNPAKATNRLMLNNNGVYFVNVAKGETLMTITSEGNVVGKGQLAMGQGMSNDGNFSNVLGHYNSADGDSAGVSGGYANAASGHAAQISGGAHNGASGPYSFVGGGYRNAATSDRAAVVGGGLDTASALCSFVGGGWSNDASGQNSTVAGGIDNGALGYGASVGGGLWDTAGADYSYVGGGRGNTASGQFATVPGGGSNRAAGDLSFAAGRRAKALNHGCFVWGDNTAADFASTADNQFLIRASGGVGINTNSPAGALNVEGGTDVSATTPNSGAFIIGASGSGVRHIAFDDNEIQAKSNDTTAGTLNLQTDGGNVGIGASNATAKVDIGGSTGYNLLRMRTSYTPTGTSDTNGNVGDIAWDSNYIYVKTSAGWKRAALSTW